ncbi:hypothetical protein Tel_00585 [Candidatus Tenderia electrophaga]|jgi:hypothetical protein|uniref:Zinc-ribbon domain-containing protein n=1 Tax=Candidatus Tenderia electrophaga TaxID=1748243 RepID=A0A0S2T9D7_9GAMM|nr:hypothetical protein Tel_00585 [Candidatus Tenderia electrophaga]
MKRFQCHCGQEVFFENRRCQRCGRHLGYDPQRGTMVALAQRGGDGWWCEENGVAYRLCGNRLNYGVCNGLVEVGDSNPLCVACRLNRTIPNISIPQNLERWGRIEQAKRRLIYGLLELGLPLEAPVAGYPRGLSFDFLEDQRSNPAVPQEFVTTGHFKGVITLNVLEADDVQRVWQRELSSERYRTVLGHFRHESGHYYFELLVPDRQGFMALFGDPGQPYGQALQRYYNQGALAGWENDYISAYASAHPIEDWAECFAHYLHMLDTLETAAARGIIVPLSDVEPIDRLLQRWDTLAVSVNELNRSLGLQDAYPFVVTPAVADKLRFVDAAIGRYEAVPT